MATIHVNLIRVTNFLMCINLLGIAALVILGLFNVITIPTIDTFLSGALSIIGIIIACNLGNKTAPVTNFCFMLICSLVLFSYHKHLVIYNPISIVNKTNITEDIHALVHSNDPSKIDPFFEDHNIQEDAKLQRNINGYRFGHGSLKEILLKVMNGTASDIDFNNTTIAETNPVTGKVTILEYYN